MWGNCDLGGRSSGRFHDGAPAVTVRPMLRQENGERPRADPGRQETGYSEVGFSRKHNCLWNSAVPSLIKR